MVNKTLQIEKAIIGAWLLAWGTVDECVTQTNIQASWFQDSTHRLIVEHILNLAECGEETDALLLVQWLVGSHGWKETVAQKFVTDCQEHCPASTHATKYATELKKCQANLSLTKASGKLLETKIDTLEKISQTAILLEEAEKYVSNEKLYTAEQIIEQLYDDWATNNQKHYKTKHTYLDQLIQGLADTRLYILAARPGVGKTSYILDIASKIAETGKPVLFVSLEMEKRELLKRLISSMSECDSRQLATIYSKKISENIAAKIDDATKKISGLPLTILDEPTADFANIRAAYAQTIEQYNIKPIIVIDYLQLIRLKGRNSRYDEVTDISRQLKLLAKKLDTPVVCLSQLNREVETRADGKAKLSDLRDSGAIEQDADVVILMYKATTEGVAPSTVKVEVAKNRHGGCGVIDYSFIGQHTRFVEVGKGE